MVVCYIYKRGIWWYVHVSFFILRSVVYRKKTKNLRNFKGGFSPSDVRFGTNWLKMNWLRFDCSLDYSPQKVISTLVLLYIYMCLLLIMISIILRSIDLNVAGSSRSFYIRLLRRGFLQCKRVFNRIHRIYSVCNTACSYVYKIIWWLYTQIHFARAVYIVLFSPFLS